ncbi:MAG: hypothetical protein JO339_26715 [Alphaproteobacteria bacterium]|nr:hypothetical protein [Alphaproteobacteria bacterium]
MSSIANLTAAAINAVTGAGNFNVKGGTFTQAATPNNFPAAATSEILLQNNLSGGNVVAAQNQNQGGFSAYTCRDYQGYEKIASGLAGPTASSSFWQNRAYTEIHNGQAGAGVPVPEYVFAVDGQYGRTGTFTQFQNFQLFTINESGIWHWSRIPWVNGNEQVLGGGVTESGVSFDAHGSQPPAIEVARGYVARWTDNTTGAPKLWLLTRDTNGDLYKASVPISTILAAQANDNFNATSGATALNGRAASGVGTWGVISNVWGITSNQAYRSSGSADDYAYINTGASDVAVYCDITLSAVRASPFLIIRGVDANNYTYLQINKNPGGNTNSVQISKKVSGSFATIAQKPYSFALGSTYHVLAGAKGNSLYVYVNDVLVLRTEDNTHIGATRQGIGSYIGVNDDDGGTTWDNFRVDI